jgi:hypothetical protein
MEMKIEKAVTLLTEVMRELGALSKNETPGVNAAPAAVKLTEADRTRARARLRRLGVRL